MNKLNVDSYVHWLKLISIMIYCFIGVRCIQDVRFYETTKNDSLNKNNELAHKYDIFGPEREIDSLSFTPVTSGAIVGLQKAHYEQLLMRRQRQYTGPHFKGRLQADGQRNYSPDGHRHLLNLHNLYRTNVTPSAADMNFLEHDDYLAYLAQLWAENCFFEHGTPPNTNYPGGAYGQNLYWGSQPDGEEALRLFYAEYRHYNIFTHYCVPGEQCGHYKAMGWAETKKVGCGVAKCTSTVYHLVCHYFPPVMAEQQMFKVGIPCSQCDYEGGALCYNNLCLSWEQCQRNPEICSRAQCTLECRNCGRLDPSRCRCDCADGWDSFDCSRVCLDTHKWCGKNPGFPDASYCNKNPDMPVTLCRKMCGTCKAVSKSSGALCCEGKTCTDGYVLDAACECFRLCPGYACGAVYLNYNIYVVVFHLLLNIIIYI